MASDVIDEAATGVSVVSVSRFRRLVIRLTPATGTRLNGLTLTQEDCRRDTGEWAPRFIMSLPIDALDHLIDGLLEAETEAVARGWLPPDADGDGEAASGW
jgi:hypothetical protein